MHSGYTARMPAPRNAPGALRGPLLCAFAALGCASSPGRPPPAADLLLRGGTVFVAGGKRSTAVAIRGDRIAALGEDAERMAGPTTRVVDLSGRLVTPGMNDAHCHLGAGGLSM